MKKFFSGLRNPCKIEIELNPTTSKRKNKTIVVNDPNDQFGRVGPQTFVLYDQDDPVSGKVKIIPEKTFEHQGVKIELIGEIVMYFESKQTSTFINLLKELSPPGTMSQDETYEYEFQFQNIEKEHESYRGINADLRYYVRVTVVRSMFSVVKEQEFWVQTKGTKPEGEDEGISMEVGLEGIVLLAIKYENVYHELKKGCILGKLKFYLVNVKIDKAEVSIIKKETAGVGDYAVTEQEVLKKFEIIDGTPAKDEIVPVRMYLSAIEPWKLCPTVSNVQNKFSVKYFIHLALCDTKGRRFFKQKEIVFWRKSL